jgi:hypothetical protein
VKFGDDAFGTLLAVTTTDGGLDSHLVSPAPAK